MSRWLAPPVYIRDAYDAVLRAMDERFVYAGTPESVMQDYLPKPSSQPAYMRELWGFIRENITRAMYDIFVLPKDLGSWTTPYNFFRHASDIDNQIKHILEDAGINPAGWFFESNLPLPMVNPSFLEAAYHLLNNYIVYNKACQYEFFSTYRRTEYRKDNKEIISTDNYSNYSTLIAQSFGSSRGYISDKMLTRKIISTANHLYGEWLIKSVFYAWKRIDNDDILSIIAFPGEYTIHINGKESDNIASRVTSLVDMDYFLHKYEDGPELYERPRNNFATGNIFRMEDTQVLLTKENLPPLTYKYYDPPI